MLAASENLLRRTNDWAFSLSPWGYAAFMASGLAAGTGIGIVIGRLARGAPAVDLGLLTTVGVGWLAVLLVMRLIAPALQRGMRQHQQWRDERREQSKPESSVS